MPMLPPVMVSLGALSGDLKAKVGEAKAELKGLEDSGNSGMSRLGSAGKVAAIGVAAIAVTAVAVGAATVKMASDFQASTTQIVTGAGESEKTIEMVRSGILAMSGSVGAMPEELSKGFYLIASSGYHGAQGLDVLRAAAEGAKVGGADLATVAGGLTTALTDYAIPASRSNAVTSALVQTVADGKMKMQDLASSLGMVMPKASALGVSFQDVTGAMATMTAGGMSARRASMNLSNTILSLGAPSKGATDALKGIGLSAQQVKDDMSSKGLGGTMELIEEHVGSKFPKGSVAAVTALKAIMGGTTGYGTSLALTGTHAAAFEANVKNIGGALKGQTSSVQGFALVQKDLSFQVDSAKATMNAWGIQIGTTLLPIVTKLMVYVNTVAIPALKLLFTQFMTYLLPILKQVASFITGTVVPAFMKVATFITGTAVPALVSFAKFLASAKEPIGIIAAVITAVFLPALIRMGVQAAISGAETVALWVMIQASAIAATATSVAQFVIQGAKWVWMGVMAMANAAVIAAAWLISMGPIVLVIAAVVGLGILIATHMDLIKGWISAAWHWVESITGSVWNGIKAVIAGVWGAITGTISGAVNGVKGILNWFGSLGGLFSGWFNSAKNAAGSALGGLVSFVAGIPGKILSGLGNLGSLLLSAGGDLVRGFISGIGSMAHAVVTALVGLLPGPLKKFAGMLGLGSPSKVFAGFGMNIVEGLINGIEGQKGALAVSMAGLAVMPPKISPMGGGVTAGSVAAGTPSGATPNLGGAVKTGGGSGGGGVVVNIDHYSEASKTPTMVAAELAFRLRTA